MNADHIWNKAYIAAYDECGDPAEAARIADEAVDDWADYKYQEFKDRRLDEENSW